MECLIIIYTKNEEDHSVANYVVIAEVARIKQELQEVLKLPIEIFWNLEASLKSQLLYL